MKTLEAKMSEVIVNCHKIDQMRQNRESNVIELDNLYESTVKTIIDITPDVSLNQWMDGKLSDMEVMAGLSVDREYAESFIENIIQEN